MFLLRKRSSFLLTTALTVVSYSAMAQYLTAQGIYGYAINGDYKSLSQMRGYLDIPDGNGNTALCLALADGNKAAVNALQSMGANTNAACVKRVIAEQQSIRSPSITKGSSMFDWGAPAWTALGVLAVGGIIVGVSTDSSGSSGDSGGGDSGGGDSGGGDSGGDDSKDVVGKEVTAGGTSNEEISVSNFNNVDAYGVVFENGGNNAATVNSQNGTAKVTIDNGGEGSVYGLFSTGSDSINNAMSNSSGKTATGSIDIINKMGNVYGIKAKSVNNAYSSDGGTSYGSIDINNTMGDGSIYGISATDTVSNALSKSESSASADINIITTSNSDVRGIYAPVAYNAQTQGGEAIGNIYIRKTGNNSFCGMYGNSLYNTDISSTEGGKATGTITILNLGKSTAYGIYAGNIFPGYEVNASNLSVDQGSNKQSSAKIEIVNNRDGHAIGIYGNNAKIVNTGEIFIHNLNLGKATGIYADGTSSVINTGTIEIDKMSYTDTDGTEYTPFYTTSGQAIGIYGSKNSTINNTGRILINGADSDKRYGIYSNGGTVLNSGTIIVGAACSGEDCFDTELYPNAIVLNGGILLQNGTLEVTNTDSDSPASLNLNNFDGMVVASDTSKFVADGAVSGTINMSSSVVGSGFAEEYRVSDMISATDISALNLQSQSLLFDVKLENGKDAVLTMKSFADVTENASMAEFLQQNYAAQNNESLFNILKSQQTLNTFNETVDTLSGNKVFDKFMFEDLNAWRELSFNMSQNMLQTDEKTFSIVGSSAPLSLGNEKTQNSYAISGVNRGDYSYGMGMALADMHSGKSAGNNAHHDRQFQLAMPLGYRTHGFKLLTTPRFGFAYGTYEREGYNGTNYDGTVEKRLFGINNEVRYPLKMASWTVAPTLEFNLLGYHLKGHETAKQYSINIKSQDNYSMETGMGIYANRELVPSKDAKLKLSGGVGVYHEFANPYDIELQMNGMSGSWTLHDENRSRERAVVRTGLDYDYQDFSLYGHISSYIDNQYRTNVDLGIKYKF